MMFVMLRLLWFRSNVCDSFKQMMRMINSIECVGLSEALTGISREPPYLAERLEPNSFQSGCTLQTKTSPPPRVPLKTFMVGQSLRISDIKAGALESRNIGNM